MCLFLSPEGGQGGQEQKGQATTCYHSNGFAIDLLCLFFVDVCLTLVFVMFDIVVVEL